jgi:hypothetical protein
VALDKCFVVPDGEVAHPGQKRMQRERMPEGIAEQLALSGCSEKHIFQSGRAAFFRHFAATNHCGGTLDPIGALKRLNSRDIILLQKIDRRKTRTA